MHATTKSDTLGAGLALLALIVYRGFDAVSLKLLLILIFILITNPVAAHIIAKAAYYRERSGGDKGNADI
jgi:multicomponent Na+:H+ antiporter subunit G